MINKKSKKIIDNKRLLLVLVFVLILFSVFGQTACVFATSAAPTQIPTNTATGEIQTPTPVPTPSPSPTATKEPEFLQDFTIPPLQTTENPGDSDENKTAAPDSAGATIGIVEVDNIETKRPFMWSDLIKYLAYVFFALAVLAVLYGLISMAALIFFKKDITLAGMRSSKKETKKKNKK